jgi:hypothetical protein
MRRLTALVTLALATSLAACGSDKATNPADALTGQWDLTTVNGAPLPFVVRASNPKIEILTDQMAWAPDGTFAETGTARYTDTTGAVIETPYKDAGRWTLDAGTISVQYASDGATMTGPVSGSSLTIAGFGLSQVYVRQ